MKARFMQEQLPVKIIETEFCKYVYICINGEKKAETFMNENNLSSGENTESSEEEYWEYDYNEFTLDDTSDVDIEDVKTNPEKYITYGVKKTELEEYKDKKIAESKTKLEKYLAEHPLFSTAKYEDGRYYNITEEKQRQLTSKMAMYNIYSQQSLSYPLLKWNDTGNECEQWTIEELTKLSMEIDAYVTPLVSKQQQYEVSVKEAESIADIDAIELKYE